ncbi:hypothetical protein BGZ65_011641, partial [Modicella reniformis]
GEMRLSDVFSSHRALSVGQRLELAKFHLEYARKTQEHELILVMCEDASSALSNVEKAAKKALKDADDVTLRMGIATAYSELGTLQNQMELSDKAQASFMKAKKWEKVEVSGRRTQSSDANSDAHLSLGTLESVTDIPVFSPSDFDLDTPIAVPLDSTLDTPVAASIDYALDTSLDSAPDTPVTTSLDSTLETPAAASLDSASDTPVTTSLDSDLDAPLNSAVNSSGGTPFPSSRHKGSRQTLIIPVHIFANNVRTTKTQLPKIYERPLNTPQLAFCLSLLQISHSSDDILESTVRNWLQAIKEDGDEQEWLKTLAMGVIREFKRDEFKDAKAVAE